MTSLSCHLSRAEVGVLLPGWLWKSSSTSGRYSDQGAQSAPIFQPLLILLYMDLHRKPLQVSGEWTGLGLEVLAARRCKAELLHRVYFAVKESRNTRAWSYYECMRNRVSIASQRQLSIFAYRNSMFIEHPDP